MILRTIKIIFVLAVGFIFHQLPQYNRLYIHTLRGAFYEAKKVFLEHQKLAIQSKKNLREYVAKYQNSLDPDLQNLGENMMNQIKRYKRYLNFLQLLKEKHPFIRHTVLLFYFEYDIMKLIEFDPGLLFTDVGVFYFAVGCFIGLGLLWLISQIQKIRFRSRKEESL